MIKNITNDELAIMMKEGFDEAHEKFATKEEMSAGFEKIHERFATREEIYNNFASKEDHNKLEAKFDKLDKKFDSFSEVLDAIVHKFDKMNTESVSNLFAHNRINRDLFRLKKHTSLKSMEVLEPIE